MLLCDVFVSQLYESHMSWFLPLNTPYTPIVSHHLINLLENGVLGKLYEMHVGSVIRKTQVCAA